jgi:hypothetical protein
LLGGLCNSDGRSFSNGEFMFEFEQNHPNPGYPHLPAL